MGAKIKTPTIPRASNKIQKDPPKHTQKKNRNIIIVSKVLQFCIDTRALTFLKLILFLTHSKFATRSISQSANHDRLITNREIEPFCNSHDKDECNPGADNAAGSLFFEAGLGIVRLFEVTLCYFGCASFR